MFTFKEFLSEDIKHNLDLEIYLHPTDPLQHIIKTKHIAVTEALTVDPNAPDTLEGGLHRALSKFKPRSLDHASITNGLHEYLYKNGYMTNASSHPLVLSPEQQAFKSEWKQQLTGKPGKHEKLHQDLTAYNPEKPPEKKGQLINPVTGVWSTRGATKISASKDDKDQIPNASTAGNIHVFDDSKAYHRASGERNRWFARISGITRIPPGGLASVPRRVPLTPEQQKQYPNHDPINYGVRVRTGLTGQGTRMADDLTNFMADKKENGDKLGAEVKRELTPYENEQPHEKAKRERLDAWVRENYPRMHPDHPENPNYDPDRKKTREREKTPEQKAAEKAAKEAQKHADRAAKAAAKLAAKSAPKAPRKKKVVSQ